MNDFEKMIEDEYVKNHASELRRDALRVAEEYGEVEEPEDSYRHQM